MIPNLDQLLIVCGVSLAGVALIVWLMLKIPDNSEEAESEEQDDK